VFEKKNVDTLPKHRSYDYTIDLEEETQPPFKPIYNLSQNKFITLPEYINKNLEKKVHLPFQVFSWCSNLVCQEK
jgi:hypothetical protein